MDVTETVVDSLWILGANSWCGSDMFRGLHKQ